ncbi:hypothetical protein NW752_003486 [Fusarium irregulare]|uniref:BTB domain-containing protein n=1 Tax=Fusarium irregulare TaxID=2494466 RepID=A0A9W8PSH3_9HYPO|nr:hypothetical protein NW766_004558 [Fusarium irregulare]KAJ4023028.1 hypothetical protein NW752_003486 [Fusarium irregulare]
MESMESMESITYDIAPGGDIEIVLNKPNEQNIIPRYRLGVDTDYTHFQCPEFKNPPCDGRYAVLSKLYEDPRNYKVLIRVSSSHLKFASRTFRVMLEGPWKEGASSSEPFRQINATGWDALAFVIVLDAIHGRHLDIPDKPTLGLLTRVATVIDYYECHEPLYVYFDRWLNHNPEVGCRMNDILFQKTLLCLYVAWVFSDNVMFNKMARVIFRHSEGLSAIDTSDVPSGGVLERIDKKRQHALQNLFQSLEGVEMALLTEKKCPEGHSSDCLCRTLGGLMRAKFKLVYFNNPLQYPHVQAPYEGYSIASFLDMIENVEKPRSAPSSCAVEGRMRTIIRNVETCFVDFTQEESTEDYGIPFDSIRVENVDSDSGDD